MIPRGLSGSDTLWLMINGVSQALHVAATLGLADLLRDGPRTVDDLAKRSAAHGPSLYRLLRALASTEVESGPPKSSRSCMPGRAQTDLHNIDDFVVSAFPLSAGRPTSACSRRPRAVVGEDAPYFHV
jgi:hypothetical protein